MNVTVTNQHLQDSYEHVIDASVGCDLKLTEISGSCFFSIVKEINKKKQPKNPLYLFFL